MQENLQAGLCFILRGERMLAYYGTKISEHMTDTPEGYLVCRDVPIARTGEMTYRAAELELEGDPDRLITVRREESEVFSPAAIASFEGKDVTAGHPAVRRTTPPTRRAMSRMCAGRGRVWWRTC